MKDGTSYDTVTITLNPAIDRTVTIPAFTPGRVNRAEEIGMKPGGKGVNVASALADYGHRVAVTGFLGFGNCTAFEDLFTRKEIGDYFVRIDGEVRIGIKIVDPVLSQTTDINFPGPGATPGHLTELYRRLETLKAPWAMAGGSVPPGIEPSIYREIVTRLRARGAKVVLDTSGTPLALALEAGPQIIKPNLHELEDLFGARITTEEEVIRVARTLLVHGMEMVVVSMGSKGACFVTGTETIIAVPPSIEVQSTVGAGDAMVAGIVSAQIDQLPLVECARLATAFSVNVLASNPDVSDLRAAVEEILPLIVVRRV